MEKAFFKAVVFCSNPFNGYYRFEDKFQLYPLISEKAPKNAKVKMYPVVIEYWIDKVEEMEMPEEFKELQAFISKHSHSNNYQRQILSLLSSISNYRFYYPLPEVKWFAEIPEGELYKEMDNQSSKAGLSYYYYPDMEKDNFITSFTEPQVPKIDFVKHPDCFMTVDLEHTEEVMFPEHIDGAIHNYFVLSDDARDIINSAASLICNGLDLRSNMRSLSVVSFVSSIETMVSYEFREEAAKKCEACGSEAFRVIGKFKEYLLKYGSDNSETKKRVVEIYKLRSKIAHTGLLLIGDNKIDWGNKATQNEQWQLHLQAMQISRVSLTNWLLMRDQENK